MPNMAGSEKNMDNDTMMKYWAEASHTMGANKILLLVETLKLYDRLFAREA